MASFGIGDKIHLIESNGNIYEIVATSGGCYELEAIEYYAPEDLGDGIMIYGFGQSTWVAGFFEYNFKFVK